MPDRRQISDEEKAQVLQKYGMHCFIDHHPIESEDDLEFDHIVPVALGGASTTENVAPVCRKHNRQKRTMSLQEYRDYLQLAAFFSDGAPKYLDDVIVAKGHKLGEKLQYEVCPDSGAVILYLSPAKQQLSLYTCPATGWHYFYALIPVQYLKNDRDLQPRALRHPSMWGLYRHFQRNTQLAPSICRFDDCGTLLLFDGQHKAAAQIWAGRRAVECKVYVRPTSQVLKETNLEAHQSYRQMSFYAYELMAKYADIFGADWKAYVDLEGRKSEAGFVDYLVAEKQMSLAKARREVANAIHLRILNDPANKLCEFTSDRNRTRQQPLTYYRIQKTLFQHLLSPIPNWAEFQSGDDYRDEEERNMVRLMSIIAEEGLIDRWNPELNNALHRKTERIFSSGSVRAWVRILRDVLFAHLRLYLAGQDQAQRVLYRRLTDDDFQWVRRFVRRIFAHSVWEAPDTSNQDISKSLTKDDDTTALNLLRSYGLDVNWVISTVT